MHIPPVPVAGLLDRLVLSGLPGRRGLDAWTALLRANATLDDKELAVLERALAKVTLDCRLG